MWVRIAVLLSSWFVSSVVVGILVGKSIAMRSDCPKPEGEPDFEPFLTHPDFAARDLGLTPADAHFRATAPSSRSEQLVS
jgi:hypothetical protein